MVDSIDFPHGTLYDGRNGHSLKNRFIDLFKVARETPPPPAVVTPNSDSFSPHYDRIIEPPKDPPLETVDDDDDGFSVFQPSSNNYRKDDYPSDQLESLKDRQEQLPRPLPVISSIPTGCGVLLNLQLVGIFPTARWLTDPTMPPDVKEMFGGTPFFALGEYRVAHLDLRDAGGTVRPLTLVINSGVEGMQTGYWGGAFCRTRPHTCMARFETTGDTETTIVQRHMISSPEPEPQSTIPGGPTLITPTSVSSRDGNNHHSKTNSFFVEYSFLEFVSSKFEGGVSPGICHTQFEKLLGVAVEFILTQADWKALPNALVEVRDTSPRAERKKSRQRPRPEEERSHPPPPLSVFSFESP